MLLTYTLLLLISLYPTPPLYHVEDMKVPTAMWSGGQDIQEVPGDVNVPEFQRIARTDKKAFLSDQYKDIEENNRMGKTRDGFKKIRDTKGIFHAKMDK